MLLSLFAFVAMSDHAAVLEHLRATHADFAPREACSVTIRLAEDKEGEDEPDTVWQFDAATGGWTMLEPADSAGTSGQGTPPEDRYLEAVALLPSAWEPAGREDGQYAFTTTSVAAGGAMMGDDDISERMNGRMLVDASGDAPFVRHTEVTLKKPFRMRMVARVRDFSVVADYAMVEGRGPSATGRVSVFDIMALGGQRGGVFTQTFSGYDCSTL